MTYRRPAWCFPMMVVAGALWLAACPTKQASQPDAALAPDAGDATPLGELSPRLDFDRYCAPLVSAGGGTGDATDWRATAIPGEVQSLDGTYLGVYTDQSGIRGGSLMTMKVIPRHAFVIEKVRVAYSGASGPIKIRLFRNYGRSYPHLHAENPDLIQPINADIVDPDPDTWLEFDVAPPTWQLAAGGDASGLVLLQPTEHYVISSEQIPGTESTGPWIASESFGSLDHSLALIHLPGGGLPWGTSGNFRLMLVGRFFCPRPEAEREFQPAVVQPWADVNSSRVAITDLDGDGHDDLVLNAGGPVAYLGDGAGGFAAPGWEPFPEVPEAAMLVFADVDNDGDVDAFAGHWVGSDDDGDGVTKADGDCDDANDAVFPGQTEVPANGLDDDCDGVTDDGSDLSDADGDASSIAAGDCDDTRVDVYPGAPELRDGRDNDCDGEVDEIFVNRILLNDGGGQFAVLQGAGVEVLDHATAAGFGDANGDGNLDLYWGNWLEHYPNDPGTQDAYVTGNGDGSFTENHNAAGLHLAAPMSCYGVMWNDYNNDGHQDIYVGNYHLYANQLWENQGAGNFIDVAETVGAAYDDIPGPYSLLLGGHSYGGDFGDIDNDGDMDMFMANLAHPRVQPWSDPSMFLINSGPPDYSFTNEREAYGFIYDEGDVNASFADYDNDGDLDIAVASLYTGHYSRLYRNDGGAGFTDITYETGIAVHDSVSVVWSDVDEDGDLDLFIADRSRAPWVQLFINEVGNQRQWIQLLLEGTTTNRSAIGARVTLTAGGVTQMRDVRGGGGHSNTQNSRVVHFGLGDETTITSVTVRWVGGATETITGLTPGRRYHVVEGSGVGTPR